MQSFGYPVVLDVTHSLQQPNQTSGVTGGMPQLIETIAKAGIAVGADGIFIETHENPAVAKSDGANMLKLDLLEVVSDVISKSVIQFADTDIFVHRHLLHGLCKNGLEIAAYDKDCNK